MTRANVHHRSLPGPDGPAWYPTVFVIDASGVIRRRNLRDEALDKVVDKLLKEIENAPKR
jgi:hypothetical protein